MNNAQKELLEEFNADRVASRKVKDKQLHNWLMAWGYAKSINDYVMMITIYNELYKSNRARKEGEYLLKSMHKHIDPSHPLNSTTKDTAIYANYKKRINHINDFAERLIELEG